MHKGVDPNWIGPFNTGEMAQEFRADRSSGLYKCPTCPGHTKMSDGTLVDHYNNFHVAHTDLYVCPDCARHLPAEDRVYYPTWSKYRRHVAHFSTHQSVLETANTEASRLAHEKVNSDTSLMTKGMILKANPQFTEPRSMSVPRYQPVTSSMTPLQRHTDIRLI